MSSQTIYGRHASEWDRTRVKWSLASLQSGARETGGGNLYDDGVFSIGGEHIGWTGQLRSEPGRYISEEFYKKMNSGKVSTGDVLLVKDGATIGKLALVKSVPLGRAAINEHVFILRVNQAIAPAFLFYFLQSDYGQQQIQLHIKGSAQPGLNSQFINYVYWKVPTKKMQKHIVDFLDREVAKIDTLIEKKQRQIELLQEKRATLISQAVTKGLNPKAKMQDSGIDWLGEIPEHWEICLFKRVMKIAYGVGGELDRTLTEGTPILSLPNVSIDGNLELQEVPFARLSISQRSEFLLRKGDLLFNWRNGSSDHLGKTAYFDLDGEYTHVSFLLRLRCDQGNNDSRYFHYLLNGLRITGFFSSSKAGVNNTFNLNELANLWVIVPPIAEQQSIATFLDREKSQIDVLLEKIEASIGTLREYRSALISAAVTGKIDVRKEVAA